MTSTTTRILLALTTACSGTGAHSDGPPDVPGPDAMTAVDADPDVAAGTLEMLEPLPLAGEPGALTASGDLLYACATSQPGANREAVVMRLSLDGTPDTSFGDKGSVRIANAGIDTRCTGLATRDDGTLVVSVQAGERTVTIAIDSQGVAIDGKGMDVNSSMLPYVVGGRLLYTVFDPGYVGVYDADLGNYIAMSTMYGAPNRPYEIDGNVALPGLYTWNGDTGWSVLHAPPMMTLTFDAFGVAKGGGDAVDDMHDSVLLPDSTIFAVGGADGDAMTMTAHLGAFKPEVWTRTVGDASVGRAVVLDAKNRPVVLGSRTVGGVREYLWERHDATSLELDTTYLGEGTQTHAAPSGSGELVAAVRVNGAIYALASYDAGTNAPLTALVKISE